METVERDTGHEVSDATRLNCFIRYALGHAAISSDSARRISELNESQLEGCLDPDVVNALATWDLPPNAPLVPSLRTADDFDFGEEAGLVLETGSSFQSRRIGPRIGEYIMAQLPDATPGIVQLVAPSYVGLVTNSESTKYNSLRRGPGGKNGTKLSYVYANTELARLLSAFNIGTTFDHNIIKTVRRRFHIALHHYEPQERHRQPLLST